MIGREHDSDGTLDPWYDDDADCDADCFYELSGNYCPECHRGD
jgi:hypothetical protein